ncbi:MAG: Crp/Fnr family transcriptional regulator [Rhodocyclaceae bacterium]|nr:MAG: Crp/Fnr family transcriptional regulator [Rhodocyclaceae bacterium]
MDPVAEGFQTMSETAPEISVPGKCLPCEVLLAGSSTDQRAAFETLVDDYDFAHSQVLYHATTPVDTVYCVKMGAIKLVAIGPCGEQRIVRILKTGDIAEIESIFSQQFEHTAIAIGDVSVCRIPVEWFRRSVTGSGQTQMWLLQKSLTSLINAETWFSQLAISVTPSRTRLARLLLKLRVDDGHQIYRLGIKELGAIVGLAPETVSRILADFDGKNIITKYSGNNDLAKRYFLGNTQALEEIAREV